VAPGKGQHLKRIRIRRKPPTPPSKYRHLHPPKDRHRPLIRKETRKNWNGGRHSLHQRGGGKPTEKDPPILKTREYIWGLWLRCRAGFRSYKRGHAEFPQKKGVRVFKVSLNVFGCRGGRGGNPMREGERLPADSRPLHMDSIPV